MKPVYRTTHFLPGSGGISRWLVPVLSAVLLASCAAPEREAPKEQERLVYPPPPAEPRFVYQRSIVGSVSVQRVTEENLLQQALTGVSGIENEPMMKPFGVAVHKGRVFVSDSAAKVIRLYDFAEKRAESFGREGEGRVAVPLGMDTDAVGNLYVTDSSQRRVTVYDRDGNYLRAFGGSEHLDRPSGIAVTADGSRAFVADTAGVSSQNHRIAAFDPRSGELLYHIGTRGSGQGEFNLLREIALGPDGLLYVVDGGNFRIQVLEQDGTFVRAFGKPGRQFGQFARPKGIDVGPDGNVYVADAAFGNFQIFDPEGNLLIFIGTRANLNKPGTYMLPAGLEVDEDGRIYFVDQFFRRVDIYRPAGLAEDEGFLAGGPGS